jgi:hypothetical protein
MNYLKSIQSDEPFDTKQPLFHLVLKDNLDSVMKNGLIPSMPKSTIHGGRLKGETFEGVWLTSLNDPASIVDIHMLPRKYEYEGVVLEIDGSKLESKLFSIGIEITFGLMTKVNSGKKISRNDYFSQSEEIVYLGTIPPSAITKLD